MNTIYKQANVNWTFKEQSCFNYDLGTNGLDAADATLMSKYSAEMRALRDAYRKYDSTYDKEAYYLFVVKNFSDPNQKGYMVRGRAVGFISQSATVKEIAHELGHGAFGLEHTFPKVKQSSSTNLLDYGTGAVLTKKQWEEVHSSMPIFNWLDGEEDAAMLSTEYFEKYNKDKNSLVGDGAIPRWVWDNNTAALSGCATLCGIIDGICEDVSSLADMADFYTCWNFFSPVYSEKCLNIRNKTAETGQFILDVIKCNYGIGNIPMCQLISKNIEDQLKEFVINTVETTLPEKTYLGGKTLYTVGSFFIGLGEVGAALKISTTVSKVSSLFVKLKPFYEGVKALMNAGVKTARLGGYLALMKGNTVIAKVYTKGTIVANKVIEATEVKKVFVKLPKQKLMVPGKTTAIEQEIEIAEDLSGEVGIVGKVRKIYKNISFDEFAKTIKDATSEQSSLAYELWGQEKWKELEEFFSLNNINGKWPPNDGFVEVSNTSLDIGFEFDRYGGKVENGQFSDKFGNFVSDKGASFESRALPESYKSGSNPKPYRKYKVIKEIPNVKKGKAVPWFEQKGLGIQYKLPYSIDELLEAGFIKLIE